MSHHYRQMNLKDEIVVRSIYTFHYTELTKDYIYEGESHNFWEFLYVDKGELEIVTDANTYQVRQGDMVFYSPNEFHRLQSNRNTPSNIFVISFGSTSKAMSYLAYKSLRLGNAERQLLAMLMEEGRRALIMPAGEWKLKSKRGDTTSDGPEAESDSPYFGSEQLVKIYLEALLIRLIRSDLDRMGTPRLSTITKEREVQHVAAKLESYLEERAMERLTLTKICSDFSLSKTYLNTVFRQYSGRSIMEFFNQQKIAKAKLLIREESCNVTEISERLGYGSIHYFSRQFKKETGMSPSEYLKSLKSQWR